MAVKLCKSVSPKVSVIVPAYNVSAYIQAALTSLEQQTLQAFEAIVVDDGSTDATPALVREFCERDDRFQLISKPNGGLSSARNYGIRHAQTHYIALLDGDDVYEPQKLQNHVAHLDRDRRIGVVYSASKVIRDDGRPVRMSLSGKPISANPLFALLCKNFVGHGSNAVFRKVLINEVGEFDESLPSSEDLDFWLRIAATERWTFYREPRALSCYRVRPSGLSFNIPQMQRSHERVLQSASYRDPESIEPWLPTAYAHMYRFLARLAFTANDHSQAEQLIRHAWLSDSSIFLRDWRSLMTLMAIKFAPVTRQLVTRSLGSIKPMQGEKV